MFVPARTHAHTNTQRLFNQYLLIVVLHTLVEHLFARRCGTLRLLTATTGKTGLNLARQLPHPEVILLDCNLPDISGLMVLNLLRADPLTAHIPVIAVSADAMRVSVQNGLAAGFFRYITKPIKVALFMQAIDEALDLAAKRITHVKTEHV